jgi:hypothetical protein
VAARIDETGVVGRDLDGLNAVSVRTRGRETDDGICAVGLCEDTLFVVDFVARAGFLADSSCRSRARRRVSFVRPERLNEGVCGGMT